MKKNKYSFLIFIFSFLFLFSISNILNAQTSWLARYSDPGSIQDSGLYVATDNAGNIYVTGATSSALGISQILTLKYNSGGSPPAWVSHYNGTSTSSYRYNQPTAILYSNGFVYVTGWVFNNLTSRDMFVIKYNAVTGDSAWARTYNGSGNGGDYSFGVAVDGTDNVYITGRSDINGSQSRYTTIKYNPSGDSQWVRIYMNSTGNFDEPHAIKVDAGSNVYITGSSRRGTTEGTEDYLTLKYNSSGVLQWDKRYTGNGTTRNDDVADALVLDATPNVYVTGFSYRYGANFDYVTIKYDGSTGDSLKAAIYNNGGLDVALAMAIDNSGNIYVTGNSQSPTSNADYLTIKYNSNLESQWTARTYGIGVDYPRGIVVNSSGEVYVTGWSFNIAVNTWWYTVKYNSSGASIDTVLFTGDAHRRDFASGIALDPSGNVCIVGSAVFNQTEFVTIRYNPSLDPVGIFQISNKVPMDFMLSQNYPNPFNPTTTIDFNIPKESYVKIAIYDILGREVAVITNENLKAGEYQANWDATGFSSGVYFYRLSADGFSQTKKMILSK